MTKKDCVTDKKIYLFIYLFAALYIVYWVGLYIGFRYLIVEGNK